jgi:hypothetical protein
MKSMELYAFLFVFAFFPSSHASNVYEGTGSLHTSALLSGK